MNRYLTDYERGDRVQTWAILTGAAPAIRNKRIWPEVVELARATMRRARANIELLVELLPAAGYVFEEPNSAYTAPPADIAEQLDAFEAEVGLLPLSLRCWFEEVGGVDLRGHHPDWPLRRADPLYVEAPLGYAWTNVEDWKDRLDDGATPVEEPFEIELAPDYLFKANISGLGSYNMVVPNPGVDGLLLNEYHQTTFVNYLRIAFQWGGFPGMQRPGPWGEPEPYGPTPALIPELAARMQPI